MPFLKFSFSTVFDNTNKLKKSNLNTKLFVSQNGNFCHFWTVLGPGVSVLALVLVVCLCVYMISNQSTRKKPHVPELRKLDVLFYIKQAFWYHCIKAEDHTQIQLSRIKYPTAAITHSVKETRQQKEQSGEGQEGSWTKFEKGGKAIGGLHQRGYKEGQKTCASYDLY